MQEENVPLSEKELIVRTQMIYDAAKKKPQKESWSANERVAIKASLNRISSHLMQAGYTISSMNEVALVAKSPTRIVEVNHMAEGGFWGVISESSTGNELSDGALDCLEDVGRLLAS